MSVAVVLVDLGELFFGGHDDDGRFVKNSKIEEDDLKEYVKNKIEDWYYSRCKGQKSFMKTTYRKIENSVNTIVEKMKLQKIIIIIVEISDTLAPFIHVFEEELIKVRFDSDWYEKP